MDSMRSQACCGALPLSLGRCFTGVIRVLGLMNRWLGSGMVVLGGKRHAACAGVMERFTMYHFQVGHGRDGADQRTNFRRGQGSLGQNWRFSVWEWMGGWQESWTWRIWRSLKLVHRSIVVVDTTGK